MFSLYTENVYGRSEISLRTPGSISRDMPDIGTIRLRRDIYRAEFQKHLSVNKKDFSTIEYLLRKGHRQLELYATPGIRNIR
ncbi:unnamed protein product [Penicillium nalgiovense]|uniref:Complex 1 LYR protein domain-containing protein n=1 Tax=Penicillium nalgiovense TaxID=60175 RepID=A0A9W4HHN3_PENNA|nr:unnamed protein product [Penicillium nalgiovense]CAG7959107.1 unnamed protein product [Penicillium nalgiovense]CAG7969497.1 unnamed protein product [Penicillium nalgiovense]CAG7980257.1 unnamed protein product [Penicillium nalgiovense]CAG7985692.1 unnamed protein product [Penicillium nalgiovense]